MVIGVVGYVSIPSIANYVVHASGGSAIMGKVNSWFLPNSISQNTWEEAIVAVGVQAGGSMASNIAGNDKLNTSMADAAIQMITRTVKSQGSNKPTPNPSLCKREGKRETGGKYLTKTSSPYMVRRR
jgi:hypothetical protein